MTEAKSRDHWAEWLLHRRHGGDADALRKTLEWLYPVRDRVLANAAVESGDVVLDVGCGDGLIAFGALEEATLPGRVIFSDISQDLLDHCHALAERMGVLERCDFIRAAAEDLSAIPSSSVDVVTTPIKRAWNPKIPTLEEAMRQLLTPEEIQRYTNYMRPLVEGGAGRSRNASVYLWAKK